MSAGCFETPFCTLVRASKTDLPHFDLNAIEVQEKGALAKTYLVKIATTLTIFETSSL